MKKRSLFIFLLLPFFCLAQTSFKIKGKVLDDLAPIPFANVVLLTQDGKINTGGVTKDDGDFEIDVKNGTYKVIISVVGFTNWEKDIPIEKDLDLGVIRLIENATTLNEVVIKTKRNTIEQKADRLIYNVGNNIAVAGGDALNALNTTPGVVVQNNSINILGKGTSRVMVDGRMVELSGEELNNFLKSLSASDIKNIEIISNPSAKYDASGIGGIININLKKGTSNSWRNTTTLSYDQNEYSFYTLRNNFSYNKNKIRFSANGNKKLGYSSANEDMFIYFPTGLWQMRGETKVKEDNLSGRLAFDYDISDRTTIGLQYLYDNYNPDLRSDITYKIYNTTNLFDSLLINNSFNNKQSGSHSYNAHLLSKLDSLGRTLNVDIDFFTFDSKFDQDFITKTFSPEMIFRNTNQSGRSISNQNIDNVSLKADMEHPFQFLNLSYGAKTSFITSKSDVQYLDKMTGTPELDSTQSNRFEYTENNQAIYVSGDKRFNDKFNFQLGLRLENTQTNGYSATLNQTTKNDYLKLFPTFNISYQKNENHHFNFNYGKRIVRPNFEFLNPFRTYINSNSYSEGNPFLKPSFSDNFDFTYAYKMKLRTNVFFNRTTDGYGVIFTSNPETNTQIVSRENYYNDYSYGIGENYSSKITNWWESRSSLYLLGSKTNFITTIDATPGNSHQIYCTTNNTFSLSETTKLQVDYMYSSSYKRGLYEVGCMSSLNMALSQNLFQKNMQITLLINNIFNTPNLKDYTSFVNRITQVYSQYYNNRNLRVSLTYNFGNNKIKVKERGFGNEEEKNRAGK